MTQSKTEDYAELLRAAANEMFADELHDLLHEAASEIERLRAAIISANAMWHKCRLPDGTVCDDCADYERWAAPSGEPSESGR